MTIDLHCHTSLSDGKLSPQALIQYAVKKGVKTLSITDHDTVAAYENLDPGPLQIVTGIELSSRWKNIGIHVVGLNFDIHSHSIREAVDEQKQARLGRATLIADKLAGHNIPGTLDGASRIAGNDNTGRPHFARYLVEIGVCDDINEAFSKYLGTNRIGNIDKCWPDLQRIIDWIRSANGIAVLAHPLTYKLSRMKLSALLDDFIEAGGEAMEVVSGRQLIHQTRDLAKLCNRKNLLASCGSDFHQPDQSWADLGQFSPLPRECNPVWERF